MVPDRGSGSRGRVSAVTSVGSDRPLQTTSAPSRSSTTTVTAKGPPSCTVTSSAVEPESPPEPHSVSRVPSTSCPAVDTASARSPSTSEEANRSVQAGATSIDTSSRTSNSGAMGVEPSRHEDRSTAQDRAAEARNVGA